MRILALAIPLLLVCSPSRAEPPNYCGAPSGAATAAIQAYDPDFKILTDDCFSRKVLKLFYKHPPDTAFQCPWGSPYWLFYGWSKNKLKVLVALGASMRGANDTAIQVTTLREEQRRDYDPDHPKPPQGLLSYVQPHRAITQIDKDEWAGFVIRFGKDQFEMAPLGAMGGVTVPSTRPEIQTGVDYVDLANGRIEYYPHTVSVQESPRTKTGTPPPRLIKETWDPKQIRDLTDLDLMATAGIPWGAAGYEAFPAHP